MLGRISTALGALMLSAGAATASDCPVVPRQPATLELMALVAADPELRMSLSESIALGQVVNDDPMTNPVASIRDYYDFIDALVTYDPHNLDSGVARGGIRIAMDGKNYCNWNILDILAYSYFLVDRQLTTDPRGQIQFTSDLFSRWMGTLAEAWGDYLETEPSAAYVPEFTEDPFFGDWYCPEAPYATFQEFFTRELCRETFPTASRPVQGYDDPRTVVSIGDSNTAGWWPISRDGTLVTTYDGVAQSGRAIKGQLYSDVHQFIAGAPGEVMLKGFGEIDPSIYDGGTWTHQFLNVNNYHRLHVPVGGRLVYMRHFKPAHG